MRIRRHSFHAIRAVARKLPAVAFGLFLAFQSQFSYGAIVAKIAAGADCNGSTSANFSPLGSPVSLRICFSTDTEKLCGSSLRLQAASAAESGRFVLSARSAGPLYNDPLNTALPAVANPAVGDLGAGPNPLAPIPAAANQLFMTLDLAPQSTAINASYVIGFSSDSFVLWDQDGACGGNVMSPIDPLEVPISASFTLSRGVPPKITSDASAIFTVTFPVAFSVTTTGTPAATVARVGTLPTGVNFSNATGAFSGTPQLGSVGSYPMTITATNGNTPDDVQNFTLIIQRANQAINNFSAIADRAYTASPFNVSALATSGLPVAFASGTTSVCSVSGASVTLLTAGTCTITASQLGNGDYNAASPISQSFTVTGSHNVTPSVIGGNGTIAPSVPVSVGHGLTTTFAVTPSIGFSASMSGTCGGSLVGTSYTTNAITADCSVIASFVAATYTVTPVVGANGSISPSAPVQITYGATTMFTVSPNSGFVASVSGCGGSLVGNTYTTGPITAPCSVNANFVALITYNIVLEGAQETPTNTSTGTGSGTAVVNTVANTITLNLNFAGLSSAVTDAHLHGPAVRGVAAAARITIGTASPITNVASYNELDEADILAGKWYVNIHTTNFGGGEIRGQIDNLGAANKTLTVARTGAGTGTVTGTGINCGMDCTETVVHNTSITLTATPAVGSTFTGWTGGGCAGTGTCIVTMNFIKTVTAAFAISTYAVTPSAGANGSINPSAPVTVNHGSTTTFTVTPVMGFTANVGGTCGGTLVGNLFTTNAITADCTVAATFVPPIAFVRAESRKTHPGVGVCNLPIDTNALIGGNVTVEPRIGPSGHVVAFVFDSIVMSPGNLQVFDAGNATITGATHINTGNDVLVTLTNIGDAQRVRISLMGVNGVLDKEVSLGFLVGDVTNTRSVNAADVSAVKAHLSQGITLGNCIFDVNVSGTFSGADVSAVKARTGRTM